MSPDDLRLIREHQQARDIPAGVYDNRATMAREWWAAEHGERATLACHMTADAIEQARRRAAHPLRAELPFGTFPDLPDAESPPLPQPSQE